MTTSIVAERACHRRWERLSNSSLYVELTILHSGSVQSKLNQSFKLPVALSANRRCRRGSLQPLSSARLFFVMPTKRKIEDFDPNKSDSADSTYGASTSKNARPRHSKSHRAKPSRKKQRLDLDGSDDISEDEDEDDFTDASMHQEVTIDEEATDYDDVTGRPKRKAKEKRQTYQEPDSEDDIEDSASERFVTPKKRKVQKSKILKLRYTPQPTSNPSRRSNRARSGSVSARPRLCRASFGYAAKQQDCPR